MRRHVGRPLHSLVLSLPTLMRAHLRSGSNGFLLLRGVCLNLCLHLRLHLRLHLYLRHLLQRL